MKRLLALTIIAFVVSGSALWAGGASEKSGSMDKKAAMGTTYSGYLVDVACGVGGKDAHGSDLVMKPGDHSKECLVMCKDSGYGISIKKGDKYMFVAFDKAGSDMAMKIALNTKNEKDIYIKVVGDMVDGKIKVSSIEETMMM